LGNEKALHLHVNDKMHRSLLEFKVLPMRGWMKDVVIEEKEGAEEKKPCALGCGDCSDLKIMLEKMCGMKPSGKSTNIPSTSFANVVRKEKDRSGLKRSARPEKDGSSKAKKRRDRSPKARRSRSRSRKSSK
jgi:hypothetical protein